jgi:predicted nucleic acid-binding protein
VSLVLDSSVTLAWVYSDETTAAVREVLTTIVRGGAWVPSLWRLEVANVLEMGVRRGRHTADFRDATLADLALVPIATDGEAEHHAWGETLQLASRHRLTVYDAAYLELAKRRALALATLDEELRSAGRAEGVQLLGA